MVLKAGPNGELAEMRLGGRSFAGREVFLQRRNQFGQWVSIRKLGLGRNSGRLFRIPRTAGRYRIFMTVNQAGAGYLGGMSSPINFRRR
jgi:hypothetical protein